MSGFGRIHIRYEGRLVDAFFQVCRYVFKTSWLLQCSVGLVGRPLRSSDWGQSCWKHGGYSQHTPQHLTETSTTDTVLLTVCVCVCLQTALGNHAITGESTHWTPGWTDSSFHQSDDSWSAFPQVLSDERRDVAGQWWPTSAVEESRGRLLTNQNLVQLFFCAQPSDLISVSVSVSSVSWKKNLPFSSLCQCQIDKSNSGHTRNRCSRTGDVSCLIKR